MYKAFHEYVPRMATPEMTAELEQDMDQIAAGETSKDHVVGISREMLHSTTAALQDQREDFAKQIWAGMDEDKFLGPCKVCEEAGRRREDGSPNRLRIIQLKGGKRMYGCEGWIRPPETKEGEEPPPPDPNSCPVSGPLPGRGYDLWRLEERCSICGEMPRLTVKGFRGRPWKLCLNDDCPSMVEMREKRAEREAAKAAREEAKAADGAEAEGDAKDGAAADEPAKQGAAASGNGARRRRPKKPSPGTARTRKAGSRSRAKR
jgi:DNA topoisomerase-1